MKKLLLLSLVCVFLAGCGTSKEVKEKKLDEYLGKMYTDYSIIDSCSYWNEAGGDELESIVKINGNFVLSSINLDYDGNIYMYYEEKILSFEQYNNYIIIGETTAPLNYNRLILLVDMTVNSYELTNYIKSISLNYSDSAVDKEGYFLEIYYVKNFNKEKEAYIKFIISQTAARCNYNFYKGYREDIGIISEFQQYHQWFPTRLNESYKNNYKELIETLINEMNLWI